MTPSPMPPQLPTDPLPATREALHQLAEHVLAAARYAATGDIGLVPAPGGFATPPFGTESTVLAVDLDELVVTRGGQQRRTRIHTVAQAADFADDEPTPSTLWPEHFDLAIVVARVNYGFSPGDAQIGEPYLYVGPFDGPPSGDDEFWNAPFGAVLGHREVTSVEDAVAFFHAGRDRVRSGISQRSTP